MLEFPAYCLVAGLAGAKWAQAPSGHVSTGLWGENSTDESQFIPTLTDAYGESERAAERKESISYYLTRARNLHNNSCASLYIDGLKARASLTKKIKNKKQRETWHERISRWWENIYLYIWWRMKASTMTSIGHKCPAETSSSHWKPESAAAVTCIRRESYLYRNAWGWHQEQTEGYLWLWTTKPVLSHWGIFVAIAKNTLYGSKLSTFLLCQNH